MSQCMHAPFLFFSLQPSQPHLQAHQNAGEIRKLCLLPQFAILFSSLFYFQVNCPKTDPSDAAQEISVAAFAMVISQPLPPRASLHLFEGAD